MLDTTVETTLMYLLYLSSRNESGANNSNECEKAFVKTKKYVWHQNKDYGGGNLLIL